MDDDRSGLNDPAKVIELDSDLPLIQQPLPRVLGADFQDFNQALMPGAHLIYVYRHRAESLQPELAELTQTLGGRCVALDGSAGRAVPFATREPIGTRSADPRVPG